MPATRRTLGAMPFAERHQVSVSSGHGAGLLVSFRPTTAAELRNKGLNAQRNQMYPVLGHLTMHGVFLRLAADEDPPRTDSAMTREYRRMDAVGGVVVFVVQVVKQMVKAARCDIMKVSSIE